MRTCIVTIATGDYIEGARVLFKSLELNGLPSFIDRRIIGPEQCDFATVVKSDVDDSWFPIKNGRWAEMRHKFLPLKLNYDRVIYMDADMFCIRDVSLLWSDYIGALNFYACHDSAAQYYYRDGVRNVGLNPLLIFNAGFYVFIRQGEHDSLYQDIAYSTSQNMIRSYEVGDQGLWNHYFQRNKIEIGYLPNGFNYGPDPYMPTLPPAERRMIHFWTEQKPWRSQLHSEPWREYYEKWWEVYKTCRPST